jgi:hypothetical protein
VLTVRQHEQDPRTLVSPADWHFVSNMQIKINRPAEFDASAIYEFIYPAQDPTVAGLGFAALRDVVSFLRHESTDETSTRNPLDLEGRPAVDHALAYGMSQAGRVLRDFVYQGFNESLAGGKVFDGMLVCMAGSRKSFVNHAFAQPGRFARQHEDRLFPHDQFPFSYATTTDPVSGKTDGILARCEQSDACPKVIQTESSSDFFQGRASLLVTDAAGCEIPIPECVRLYHFAGLQHGGGGDPTVDYARFFPAIRYAPNPADGSAVHRALLVALDRWVDGGGSPPPSQFPNVADGTLGLAASDHYGFPAIPDADYPGLVNGLCEVDYSVQPPKPVPGRDYVVMVPPIDSDGNEIAGIRVPDIAVPRGTHTGWNPRRKGYAAAALSPLGAYFPFAATKRKRLESGDPRPSLEERYSGKQDYLRKVAKAANALRVSGFLLEEDVERIAAKARDDIAESGLG